MSEFERDMVDALRQVAIAIESQSGVMERLIELLEVRSETETVRVEKETTETTRAKPVKKSRRGEGDRLVPPEWINQPHYRQWLKEAILMHGRSSVETRKAGERVRKGTGRASGGSFSAALWRLMNSIEQEIANGTGVPEGESAVQ